MLAGVLIQRSYINETGGRYSIIIQAKCSERLHFGQPESRSA